MDENQKLKHQDVVILMFWEYCGQGDPSECVVEKTVLHTLQSNIGMRSSTEEGDRLKMSHVKHGL